MTELKTGALASSLHAKSEKDVSMLWILAIMVRERRTILAITAVGLLLALALAVLKRPTYTTTFSFMPQTTQDPTRAGLANLASQFGISTNTLSGSQSPQLYAELLLTREVLAPVARDTFSLDANGSSREPLSKILRVSGKTEPVLLERTIEVLRNEVISATVASRTTGVVTVKVRTRSPYVSFALAQRLLEGLNQFNLVTRQSQAREERRFTEERLRAARMSLRSAEGQLQRFLQTNRQIANSPQLMFERDTLQREVNLQTQVTTALAQLYEEIRIREVRDTPVITVIERATLPAAPNARRRALIVVLGIVVSFGIATLIVLFRDAYRRERVTGDDPAVALLSNEWKRIRGRKA